MTRKLTTPLVTALLGCLCSGTLLALPCFSQEKSVAGEEVVVQREAATGLLQIRIPAQEGKVAWEDVLRAVIRVAKLEDSALQSKFPSGSLDLQNSYSRYALLALNVALAPDIRLEIVPPTNREPAFVLVTVDEDSLQQKRRRISKNLRERIVGETARGGEFGLRLWPGWEQAALDLPLVVVVHGFNSSPRHFEPLVRALHEAGLPSGTYSYPDDQPIRDSAERLSVDLKQLATEFPEREVALVTHSMGGLVARDALERPTWDPGNVTKLIMIAPPTHGSLLAYFAFGIDVLDHIADDDRLTEVTRFYAAVEDGLSEARNDLKPDSPFLRQLNARARNPRVRYSIILGTGGHLSQDQVDRLRAGLRAAKDKSQVVGLFAPRLDEMLADLDEVVHGKGDGVVAIKRGRLEGVQDTVLADFSHLGIARTDGSFASGEVFRALLSRLKH